MIRKNVGVMKGMEGRGKMYGKGGEGYCTGRNNKRWHNFSKNKGVIRMWRSSHCDQQQFAHALRTFTCVD